MKKYDISNAVEPAFLANIRSIAAKPLAKKIFAVILLMIILLLKHH